MLVNIRELIDGYVDMGYTKTLAIQMAREEYDKRKAIAVKNRKKNAVRYESDKAEQKSFGLPAHIHRVR